MSVTLSAHLPDDERNGIGAISAALCEDPEKTHVIVAVVDCSRITTKIDTGDVIPTARIRAIEAFEGHTADAKELSRLLRRQIERRTGKVELPLDMERAIDSITVDETEQ